MSLAAPHAAHACSSCGCTLNADWASQGLVAGSGWRLDVREDYFDQSDLRSGTDSVARGSIALPSDTETQQKTLNRNTTVGIEYSPGPEWGVGIALPYFDRFHTTIGAGDTAISTSQSRGIGDVRLLARYAGLGDDRTFGVQFGLKLATGRTDDTFRAGPLTGEVVDRGLQPGTGSTDLLIGAYKFGALPGNFDYFVQGMLQQAVAHDSDFRPGAGLNLSFGARYVASAFFVPQLQLNLRAEKRESGAAADIPNSGATLAYLSPGATLNFTRRLSGFVFVQAPVYQRVNGLQLEPRSSVSLGAHYIF